MPPVFLLFLKAAVEYLHVLVAVKQLHEYVNGPLHALAGEPFERTALVRIFFAVDAEETAHGLTERKPGEVDMIFFFEPVGKFLLCPDITRKLVSLGTNVDIIGSRSIAGKAIGLSIKAKGEENGVVAYMLHAIAGKVSVAAEYKINSKHGRGLTDGVLTVLFAKHDIKSLLETDRRASLSFFLEDRRGHFYKHEYTSPSSLISTARNAYRQSITDRKSVASDNDGLITRNRSFTSMGPFFSSVSTLGTRSRVLALYEYSLFGNCIEYLAALHEVGDDDLTVEIILQGNAVYLTCYLVEGLQS